MPLNSEPRWPKLNEPKMITSLNDKSLKSVTSRSASVKLARNKRAHFLSTSVPIDSSWRRLKCDAADDDNSLCRQQSGLFHQSRDLGPTAGAAVLSDRLDCRISSDTLTGDEQFSTSYHKLNRHQTQKDTPARRIGRASNTKHVQNHNHYQQQPQPQQTNLVSLISLSTTVGFNRQCPASSSCSSSKVIISPVAVLILLLLCSISESQCNSVPSGFLDSGHAIPCKTGQSVSISDYIPFSDSNLSRCYSCTCPNGSVQCGRVEDSPDCMLPPATKLGAPAPATTADSEQQPQPQPLPASETTSTTFVNRPASSFNKYKPASRAQPAGQSHGHLHHYPHHYTQPVWAKPVSPTNNGKAKTIAGTQQQRKQVKPATVSNGAGNSPSTPIAQPIGGPKQHANKQQQSKTPLGDHFKQLGTSGAGQGVLGRFNQWSASSLVRHHQHQVDEPDEEESVDGDADDTSAATTSGQSETTKSADKVAGGVKLRHYPAPTVRPHWDSLLASPSIPLNDPKHHSLAAAALGFAQTDDYLRMRHKYLQVIADRTSTTAQLMTTTTTISPTTTTIDEEDNATENSNEETDDLAPTVDNSQNGEQEIDLITTTTTTLMPLLQTIATDQTTLIGDDGNGEPVVPFNVPPESFKPGPTIQEQQPMTTTQQPALAQPPPVFGHDGNAIDQSASNEIMEQVSQDGMLYIAIGVEAFILVSIFAMMIVFYLYREKTPDDDDDNNNIEYARSMGQNHLQLPSRSPSIIEKA